MEVKQVSRSLGCEVCFRLGFWVGVFGCGGCKMRFFWEFWVVEDGEEERGCVVERIIAFRCFVSGVVKGLLYIINIMILKPCSVICCRFCTFWVVTDCTVSGVVTIVLLYLL